MRRSCKGKSSRESGGHGASSIQQELAAQFRSSTKEQEREVGSRLIGRRRLWWPSATSTASSYHRDTTLHRCGGPRRAAPARRYRCCKWPFSLHSPLQICDDFITWSEDGDILAGSKWDPSPREH